MAWGGPAGVPPNLVGGGEGHTFTGDSKVGASLPRRGPWLRSRDCPPPVHRSPYESLAPLDARLNARVRSGLILGARS
jgi:hypothetical protein